MNLQQAILQDADRCVLCGMCLPHCPTYQRTGNEAESPRGRISLMLALARGQLAPTPALIGHLDSCLVCRACEGKCPSEVPYGRLIGNGRRLVARHRRGQWKVKFVTAVVTRQRALGAALALARTALGRAAARYLGLESQIPDPRRGAGTRPETSATSAAPARGQVMLFTGCTGSELDRETLRGAVRLLEHAGFAVVIPERQTCCGALHHGAGDRAGFERRARANLAAFDGADTIVFVASGCGAMLRGYDEWLDGAEAGRFAARCVEVTDFLAREGFSAGADFDALAEPVAVHVPCTQANALKAGAAPEKLLRQIPGIRLISLPGNHVCCGAGGSAVISHPDTAHDLREPKLDALAASGARYLVTTNVGCALHFESGLRARGQTVEVLHPVTLLARQLAGSSLAAGPESH